MVFLGHVLRSLENLAFDGKEGEKSKGASETKVFEIGIACVNCGWSGQCENSTTHKSFRGQCVLAAHGRQRRR